MCVLPTPAEDVFPWLETFRYLDLVNNLKVREQHMGVCVARAPAFLTWRRLQVPRHPDPTTIPDFQCTEKSRKSGRNSTLSSFLLLLRREEFCGNYQLEAELRHASDSSHMGSNHIVLITHGLERRTLTLPAAGRVGELGSFALPNPSF